MRISFKNYVKVSFLLGSIVLATSQNTYARSSESASGSGDDSSSTSSNSDSSSDDGSSSIIQNIGTEVPKPRSLNRPELENFVATVDHLQACAENRSKTIENCIEQVRKRHPEIQVSQARELEIYENRERIKTQCGLKGKFRYFDTKSKRAEKEECVRNSFIAWANSVVRGGLIEIYQNSYPKEARATGIPIRHGVIKSLLKTSYESSLEEARKHVKDILNRLDHVPNPDLKEIVLKFASDRKLSID